jgi:hypothetical protein
VLYQTKRNERQKGRKKKERKSYSGYATTVYSGRRINLSFSNITERGEGKMERGKNWVISPYVLSLRGLPLPLTCVFVTVIQAQSYVASTVNRPNFPMKNVMFRTFGLFMVICKS